MSPTSRVVIGTVTALLAGSTAVAGALLTTTASAAGPGHHRPHRPDLVVSALDLAVNGQTLRGTVTVSNIGNARAGRSVTSVGGELIATPALRPRHHRRLAVATTLTAGETRLLLCVDVRHRVTESREDNNCQTYAVPPTITVSPSPTQAPSPANPTVHASTGPVP